MDTNFFFDFSKKFLNLDFLSKASEFNINIISFIFLSINSSIILIILSVHLFIIIILSLSNNDLLRLFAKNSSVLSITCFSS